MAQTPADDIGKIHQLIQRGHVRAADEMCERLLAAQPGDIQLLLLKSHIAQRLSDFPGMLSAAKLAHQVRPRDINAFLRLIECQIYSNDTREALSKLAELESRIAGRHELLHRVAGLYLHCARHEAANRCHARALQMQPGNPDYIYDLASSCIATGQLEKAEALLNQVIELRPDDFSAWQNRSTLRNQTPGANHVRALESALELVKAPHKDEVPLCYALSKELEDLGEYDRSFEYLERGADRRRSLLAYKVESDVETMDRIRQVFNAALVENNRSTDRTYGPVFILGLPRSGTTLVDRILSAHSHVQSLGEINNLAFGVIGQSGVADGKLELVEKSSQIEFDLLREAYLRGTRGLGEPGPMLIDKTPSNFLYLGLIYLAMPGAKVIHLRRHAMDSCYAIYKTLFRAGYPYSYDLGDLGNYYLAYRRLMAHWRKVLPDFIYDVDYEILVTRPEESSRKLLAFCGLDWEEGVLEFHKSKTAAATASAAQVRQPVYTSSVQRWRCYEEQLRPLENRLRANGVYID